MKTYQDLLACGNDEKRRMKFVLEAIDEHKASARYQMALTADKYRHQKNETIEKYQKLLRTMTGEMIPDIYTANHKIKSGFFIRADPSPLFTTFGTGHPILISKIEKGLSSICFAISLIITGSEPKS